MPIPTFPALCCRSLSMDDAHDRPDKMHGRPDTPRFANGGERSTSQDAEVRSPSRLRAQLTADGIAVPGVEFQTKT
jgi:hypothetical protein